MLVLVTPRSFDLDDMRAQFERDEGPRHGYSRLLDKFDATHVTPSDWAGERLGVRARLLARLYSTKQTWQGAAFLARTFDRDDTIVFPGIDLACAYFLSSLRRGPRRATVVADVDVGKMDRLVLRIFRRRIVGALVMLPDGLLDRVDSSRLGDVPLESGFGLDTAFFSDDPALPFERGLIVSAGLVDRDYDLLVRAVSGLEVRLEVSATASVVPKDQRSRFPDDPAIDVNVRPTSLRELRDLYRRAHLVVVPLLPDTRGGLTVVAEALSCGNAVIVSTSNSAMRAMAGAGLVVGVEPGDENGLRAVVHELLDDDERRTRLGAAGREWALRHASNESAADSVERLIRRTVPTALLPRSEPHGKTSA
jgi:glycosyltransferase involved in cell wall biosynthesis